MKIDNQRRGFTLVELLVVVAVIGILIGMLFPAIQVVRSTARRTSCLNNLRQVMMAAHNYEASNGKFPKAVDANGGSIFLDLSSFLDQQYVYRRAFEDLVVSETYQDRFAELSNAKMVALLCPALSELDQFSNVPGHGKFTTHYYANTGPLGFAVSTDGTKTYVYNELSPQPGGGAIGLDGLFSPAKNGRFVARGTKDVRDGTSNTIAFGEVSYPAVRADGTSADRAGWAFGGTFNSSKTIEKVYCGKSLGFGINKFEKGDVNNLAFGSLHNGGTQFAMTDGSTKFVSQKIKPDVLKTFSSISRLEIPEEYEE